MFYKLNLFLIESANSMYRAVNNWYEKDGL